MEKKQVNRGEWDKFHMTREEIAQKLELNDSQVKHALKTAIKKIKENHPELRDWL